MSRDDEQGIDRDCDKHGKDNHDSDIDSDYVTDDETIGNDSRDDSDEYDGSSYNHSSSCTDDDSDW